MNQRTQRPEPLEMGSLWLPTLGISPGALAMMPAQPELQDGARWADVPAGLPRSGPGRACSKDTLARGVLHVVPGGRGCVHLLRVGKLAHELHLEIFPSLILLPSVDEHFVLRRDDTPQGSQGTGLEDRAQAQLGGLRCEHGAAVTSRSSFSSASPPGTGAQPSGIPAGHLLL